MKNDRTLGNLLLEKLETSSDKNAIGWIENNNVYYYNYKEYFKTIESLSTGLASLGLTTFSKLTILSGSRKEWNIVDHATICQRATVVPIYPSYLSNEIEYIINHSESSMLIVENQEQLDKVVQIQNQIPTLKTIISIEELPKNSFAKINNDIDCYNYNDVIERGKNLARNNTGKFATTIKSQQCSDIVSIIYTSGTTGQPKGAVITQHAFASMIANMKDTLEDAFNEADRSLVFLPLSHVFGRCDSWLNIAFGIEAVYAESIDKIIDNIGIVRPTLMLAVPRIFEKIYEKIMHKIENGPSIKRKLFLWAKEVSDVYFEKIENEINPSLVDTFKRKIAYKLVFSKIYERFGGRIRFFVSGGAPIEKEIVKFLRNAHLTILEGYGLTETIAPCVLNPVEKQKPGSVGIPLSGVQLSFADDNEILIKTDAMFSEYYKNPEATSSAIKNGWFHSGDIGKLTDDGHLIITDRKKDIIITSGGKNIAPQSIESKIKLQNFIAQFMVVGDKRKYLTGIVGIEKEPFAEKLKEFGLDENISVEEMAAHPKIRTLIQENIDKVNKSLAKFETIKNFYISPIEFTVESGLMTPSMKIKKKLLLQKFKNEIDAMYSQNQD
ncbi:MAG: long-chain fatty acid--CoA ligase [Bacteriovoracaceae bacterium]|nr:long-chain fatty acid--CoA ligase [Bacteriovoracaceae bacterium]